MAIWCGPTVSTNGAISRRFRLLLNPGVSIFLVQNTLLRRRYRCRAKPATRLLLSSRRHSPTVRNCRSSDLGAGGQTKAGREPGSDC